MPWNHLFFSCILPTWAVKFFSHEPFFRFLRQSKISGDVNKRFTATILPMCSDGAFTVNWNHGEILCAIVTELSFMFKLFPSHFSQRELSTFLKQQVTNESTFLFMFSLSASMFLFCIVAAKNTAQVVRTSRPERHTPSVQCCFQYLWVFWMYSSYFFFYKDHSNQQRLLACLHSDY